MELDYENYEIFKTALENDDNWSNVQITAEFCPVKDVVPFATFAELARSSEEAKKYGKAEPVVIEFVPE
ncbi:hypothetical protein IWW38_005183, partial [Coemansia aciculifera]